MTEVLNQGLLIAAIGMGLVFLALILLWGLMALLGRIPADKEPAAETAEVVAEAAPLQHVSKPQPGSFAAPQSCCRGSCHCARAAENRSNGCAKIPQCRQFLAGRPPLRPIQSECRISNRKSRGSAR